MSIKNLENTDTGRWLDANFKSINSNTLNVQELKTPFIEAGGINVDDNVNVGGVVTLWNNIGADIFPPMTMYKTITNNILLITGVQAYVMTRPTEIKGSLTLPVITPYWVEINFIGTMTAPIVNGGMIFSLFLNDALIVSFTVTQAVALANAPFSLKFSFSGSSNSGTRPVYFKLNRNGATDLTSVANVASINGGIINTPRVSVVPQSAQAIGAMDITIGYASITLY